MAAGNYQILDASGRVDYKAYSAARSILRKRLERLVAKNPGDARASSILARLKGWMTVKQVRSLPEEQQKRAAEQLRGWLQVGSLSLKGVRAQTQKALATLASHGYTGLTADDLPKWGKAALLAQAAARNKWMNYETALQAYYAMPEDDLDRSLDAQSEREAAEIFRDLFF